MPWWVDEPVQNGHKLWRMKTNTQPTHDMTTSPQITAQGNTHSVLKLGLDLDLQHLTVTATRD